MPRPDPITDAAARALQAAEPDLCASINTLVRLRQTYAQIIAVLKPYERKDQSLFDLAEAYTRVALWRARQR